MLAGLLLLPDGEIAIILGPRSIGKSSIALTAFAEPWVSTSEMMPRKVLRYAKRLGARLAGVSVVTVDEDGVVDLHVERGPHGWPNVVLDSLTGRGTPKAALAGLRKYVAATGARAVATSQVVSDGGARGGPGIEHDGDALLVLSSTPNGRQITVVKSRSSREETRLYEVTDEGRVQMPVWDRYYAIEGTAPEYRLVPYPPVKRGSYDGFLRAVARGKAERRQLPPMPAAVAAQHGGSLYGDRWMEPADFRARVAFAAAHGLPYYSAQHDKVLQEVNDGEPD